MKHVYTAEGSRPIKAWTTDIEAGVLAQARNLAQLPFIDRNGVALSPIAIWEEGVPWVQLSPPTRPSFQQPWV
ncbi:MAG: hypothetical protein ACREUR_07625 [Nitrosospira sp.]